MSKVCKKHIEKPERIYGQCIGCEIESLRNEIKNKDGNFNAMVNESKEIISHLSADVKLQRKENDQLRDAIETAFYELGRLERNLEMPARGYVRNCFNGVIRTLKEGLNLPQAPESTE